MKKPTIKKTTKVWRPTWYHEDMIAKVYKYIEQCNDELINYIKSETNWQNTSSRSREQKIKVNIPTIEWLAKYIKVAVSSIYLRKEQHDWFSEALDYLLAEQKQKLINMSLWWYYNPVISKLMLSANHWMKETNIQESTWKDWWPIEVDIKLASDEDLLKIIKQK